MGVATDTETLWLLLVGIDARGVGWALQVRVPHGYGNTHGFRAAGYVGTGTVWEICTHGYTVPVTTVSRVLTGIFKQSLKLYSTAFLSSQPLHHPLIPQIYTK